MEREPRVLQQQLACAIRSVLGLSESAPIIVRLQSEVTGGARPVIVTVQIASRERDVAAPAGAVEATGVWEFVNAAESEEPESEEPESEEPELEEPEDEGRQ